MMKLNKTVQAKECFMEALSLDVKCYESFQQLIDTESFDPSFLFSSFPIQEVRSVETNSSEVDQIVLVRSGGLEKVS